MWKEQSTALKRNVDESAGMELSWADGGLHPDTDGAETSSTHLGQPWFAQHSDMSSAAWTELSRNEIWRSVETFLL